MATKCPTAKELRNFSRGVGNDKWIEEIAAHLEACENCSAKLDAIDQQADDFLDILRDARPIATEISETFKKPSLGRFDLNLTTAYQELLALERRAHLLVRINCPHCMNPIAIKEQNDTPETSCPTCGSTIRITHDQSASWSAENLPTLGKFELLSAVGRGAFGTVYRARDTELGRIVAVKVPRSGCFATPEDEERFVREARSAAQLSHPNIVPIFEVVRDEPFPFIVSEFIDGVTLADAITTSSLTFDHSARLALDIARGIQHSHDQGIIHRDIKPSNVMLQKSKEGDRRHHARIMDFGLAQHDENDVTLTAEGCILGTPAYASPEQLDENLNEVDGRTDIYSIGVTLHHMLTGELPFRGTLRMVIYQTLNDEPRSLRSLNDRIPRDLETICLKCLQKQPERRYQTAGELADDIRRYLAGEPILARPIGSIERLGKWVTRQPVVSGLIAAVALSLMLGIMVSTYFAVESQHQATQANASAKQMAIQKARADEEAGKAIESANQARRQSDRADKSASLAKAETLKAQKQLYITSVGLLPNAFQSGNIPRVREILEATLPENMGGADYRSFEWYYWWRQIHADDLTLPNHADGATAIAFNASGRGMATGSGSGEIFLWDTATGELQRKIQASESAITCLAYRNGGKTLLANVEHNAVLWDVSSGEILQTYSGHTDKVTDIVSLGGQQFATASADTTIKTWSDDSTQPDHTFRGHSKGVTAIDYSPKKKVLVSVSEEENSCRTWSIAEKKPLLGITVYVPTDVSFSPQGAAFATSSLWGEYRVNVWKTDTCEVDSSWLPHGRQSPTQVLWRQSGILTGSTDTTIKHWTAKGELRSKSDFIAGHSGSISAIGGATNKFASGSRDGTVKIWSMSHRNEEKCFCGTSVYNLVYRPDGRQFAATGSENSAILFSADTLKTEFKLKGHAKLVSAIAYSGDSKIIATGSEDNSIRLWNARTGGLLCVLTHHKNPLRNLAFSHDGAQLYSAAGGGEFITWDVASQKPILFEVEENMAGMAFSSDSIAAVIRSGEAEGEFTTGELVVRSIETQETKFDQRPKITLRSNKFLGNQGMRFSADGKLLAAIQPMIGEGVLIWDLEAGALKQTLSFPGGNSVTAIAFSSDGKRLAAASMDRILMWDLETGMEVLELQAASDARILSLAFSPDGNRLIAGNYGTAIAFWETSLHDGMNLRQRLKLNSSIGR